MTIVSFTMGKYKFNGTINDQNLVELIDTWFPNPVYGDMDYEMRYTKYKDFGGIMFPGQIHVHQGDPRLNPAHNYYEINVTDVKVNVPVTPIPVPETVRTATAPPVKVERRYVNGLFAEREDSGEADLYSPPAPGGLLPTPTAAMRTLYQNMVKLKLDVSQHVPIYGHVETNDEFLKIVGKAQ